jgi:alpha-acetolactate decarboxylase
MSELEFLGALHVELLRHRELHSEHPDHELFQTSTVQALLEGAFEGDVTLAEILEHGDLGLGTLDGIEMVGSHLHFLTDDRTRGGHVLGYTLLEASARVDGATGMHVELPPAVAVPRHGATLDQDTIRELESDG